MPSELTYAELLVYNRLAESDAPAGLIAKELPFSEANTHLSLNRLVTRGLVEKTQNGRYRTAANDNPRGAS